MPHTLNVGLTREVELEDRGSVNVACSVKLQLEADGRKSMEAQLELVNRAVTACHDALTHELQHQAAAE
jgi:hypothetical protein